MKLKVMITDRANTARISRRRQRCCVRVYRGPIVREVRLSGADGRSKPPPELRIWSELHQKQPRFSVSPKPNGSGKTRIVACQRPCAVQFRPAGNRRLAG